MVALRIRKSEKASQSVSNGFRPLRKVFVLHSRFHVKQIIASFKSFYLVILELIPSKTKPTMRVASLTL